MNPSDDLPGRITWRCDTCRAVTTTGCIHIDLQTVSAAEKSFSDYERGRSRDAEMVSLASLMLMPQPARWQVQCAGCVHNCCGCYSIDLRQCQTIYALVKWTAHLYEKNWFNATNWMGLLHRVAQEHGSAREATGVA